MYKLHIPTEQYGYVEVEVKKVDEIQEVFQEVKRQFAETDGLPNKEWNKALDTYLQKNELESGQYESMNTTQKMVIQEIKKSIKRIEYNK